MVVAKDTKTKDVKGGRAAGVRKRRRGEAAPLPMKYVIGTVVGIVVIGALLFFVFQKKPANSSAPTGKTGTKQVARRAHATGQDSKPSRPVASPRSRVLTPAPRAPALGSGPAQAPVARAPRARLAPRQRSTSSSSGGRHAKSTASRAPRSVGGQEISGISGETALIGNRPVRVGDVVQGCLIRDIEPDHVLVESQGASYNLRIGDKLP